MRKSIIIAGLAAIAAFSFSSCSKNEVDNPDLQETFTHTVTIKLDAPETRTEIVEGTNQATFKWSSDDASRFVIKENSTAGTDITLTSNDDYVTATLGATFASTTADEYVYSAYMAKNAVASGPKIPPTQSSTAKSYDPDADILLAKPLTFAATQSTLSMQFYRPVVINKMTLKGLTAGETVSSVTVSADEYITGYYNTSSDSWSGQFQEITISTEQQVPSNGQITVWFITMPVSDVTLQVTATTGNYVYNKTFARTISFKEGEVTEFGVAMEENAKDDYSGTYVLTNEAGTKMANKWEGGNNIPAVDASLEDGVVYYDPDVVTISDAQITVARITDSESTYYNMYTMVQNSKYLYAASGSANQLKGKDEPDINSYWDITYANDNWSIVASKSENHNILRNNGNIFSCYASGQTAVALHPIENVKTTPVITGTDISIEPDAVTTETSLGVTFNSDASTITAIAYDDVETTIESTWLTVSTGTSVTYTATKNEASSARIAYVVITASNSEGRSVSKTIKVTQGASPDAPGQSATNPYTVAQVRAALDAGATDECYVQGTISSVVYYYSATYGTATFYISDDGTTTSDQFEAYSVKFFNNEKWVNGNTQIALGDEVIIHCAGGVKIYTNTQTYENESGGYLYSLNGVSSETVPTITKTDISGVSADGVTNATTSITLADADGWTASVAPDGTIVTAASISGTTITYSVAANTESSRTGFITVTLSKEGRTDASAKLSVEQDAAAGVTGGTATFNFGDNISDTQGEISGVSLTSSKTNTVNTSVGNAPAYNSNAKELRIYRYGSLTLSSESNITAITITYTENYLGSDTNSNVGTYSASGTTGTWTGSSKSVTINNVGTSNVQMRIKSIVVTYE